MYKIILICLLLGGCMPYDLQPAPAKTKIERCAYVWKWTEPTWHKYHNYSFEHKDHKRRARYHAHQERVWDCWVEVR